MCTEKLDILLPWSLAIVMPAFRAQGKFVRAYGRQGKLAKLVYKKYFYGFGP